MNYIVKGIIGLVISVIGMVLVMPRFIAYLKKLNLNQCSEFQLEEFKKKANTPIMGGLLFVLIPVVVFVFIARRNLDSRILFVLLAFLSFCLVGFLDDFMIILERNNAGLSPLTKLIMEALFTAGLYVLFKNDVSGLVDIPFTGITVEVFYMYLPFMIAMFLAEANAVNFTDGMDGLCAGVSSVVCIGFIVLCVYMEEYVLAVLLFCVLGGLIGYLFFNWHPAKIFMGDSGSLALGGLFSAVSVLLRKEIALFVIGGIFVIEMGCVVIQQIAVRVFHKRVFRYTPIHYAFTLKGHKETKVVSCFILAACVFAVLGVFIGIN